MLPVDGHTKQMSDTEERQVATCRLQNATMLPVPQRLLQSWTSLSTWQRIWYYERNSSLRSSPRYKVFFVRFFECKLIFYNSTLATMRVYQDFFSYESGVYVHSALSERHPSAYHSVRIVGWGEEYSPFTGEIVKFWVRSSNCIHFLDANFKIYFSESPIRGEDSGVRTDTLESFEVPTSVR